MPSASAAPDSAANLARMWLATLREDSLSTVVLCMNATATTAKTATTMTVVTSATPCCADGGSGRGVMV